MTSGLQQPAEDMVKAYTIQKIKKVLKNFLIRRNIYYYHSINDEEQNEYWFHLLAF